MCCDTDHSMIIRYVDRALDLDLLVFLELAITRLD